MDIGVDYKVLFEYDSNIILESLLEKDESIWYINQYRQNTFDVHKDTESIVYVWRDKVEIDSNTNDLLHKEVWKVANLIKNYYGNECTISNLMLAKLKGLAKIEAHTDIGMLSIAHRCHLPIITDKDCKFTINSTPYSFKENIVFEFNNTLVHSVENNSNTDRIHLIVDILERDYVI